jgi:CBS domain containing-hemolysin-like protein
MRRSGTHLARVQQNGASLGMVSLEAVLRAVVGARAA